MTKIFCDKCGEELLGGAYKYTIKYRDPYTRDKVKGEYCDDCFTKIMAFAGVKYADGTDVRTGRD